MEWLLVPGVRVVEIGGIAAGCAIPFVVLLGRGICHP